ncbi:hypothetical protein LTR70_007338 [Exophiala xenobiotica]|nr:hypothetical protein LTR70_007338 [Exophiala xenobiotica]
MNSRTIQNNSANITPRRSLRLVARAAEPQSGPQSVNSNGKATSGPRRNRNTSNVKPKAASVEVPPSRLIPSKYKRSKTAAPPRSTSKPERISQLRAMPKSKVAYAKVGKRKTRPRRKERKDAPRKRTPRRRHNHFPDGTVDTSVFDTPGSGVWINW